MFPLPKFLGFCASMIRLFNTKGHKIQEFVPLEDNKVRMYTCGPTVYASQHIGNMRPYVTWDILRRVLETDGFEVTQVMNVTDVGHLFEEGEEARLGEDKLEHAAALSGRTARDIAKFYTDEFLGFIDELNIRRPAHLVKATDHIEEQISLIKTLEDRGFTYTIDDGVYFDASKFPNYGELSGGKSGLKAGARVEMVSGKKNPTDFVLWKFSPKGGRRQMEWESPWGKGFPGWHIECSAMSMKYLGGAFENNNFRSERSRTIDIHTGGIDHIPVHHSNEIAQSEAATGREFVRFWIHNEFVLVDSKKMSKSLGNVYTLEDIKKRGFNPLALRYLFLTAHYRDPLNFTWEALSAAQTAYGRLRETMEDLPKNSRTALSEDKSHLIENFKSQFFNQINNDLATPGAIAVMWEAIKSNIPNRDKYELLLSFDEVLGLNLEQRTKNKEQRIPSEIVDLANTREELRKDGKWEEADEIRKKVEDLGYLIQDTTGGPRIKSLRRRLNSA